MDRDSASSDSSTPVELNVDVGPQKCVLHPRSDSEGTYSVGDLVKKPFNIPCATFPPRASHRSRALLGRGS